MSKSMPFPDDEDGDVLRSLQSKGVDLSKARNIDFYCYVPDRATAHKIVEEMNEMGFDSRLFEDEEVGPSDEWLSVYGGIRMVPDYDDLIRTQIELNQVLARYGTHCDGWGTLIDPEERS
jgi:regulator of RNase E activity RraB